MRVEAMTPEQATLSVPRLLLSPGVRCFPEFEFAVVCFLHGGVKVCFLAGKMQIISVVRVGSCPISSARVLMSTPLTIARVPKA